MFGLAAQNANKTRLFKLIKVKIQRRRPNKLNQYQQIGWIGRVWSNVKLIKSIYNEGIRVSYPNKKQVQVFQFELIKNKWKKAPNNCFCYQSEVCTFYDDPAPILKLLGYNHFKRRSKNATIFKSLKYGLQVILYHQGQKDENNEQKGKLQIIESGSFLFGVDNLMIGQIQPILKKNNLIIQPLESQLQHERMTLKNLGSIDQFK